MLMTLGQAHALLPGSQRIGDPATALLRVHSDTRSVMAGDLFVALRGERFDGHEFLIQAQQAGAAAALAERGLGQGQQPIAGLLVPDALLALQHLAAAWRARFHLALIAVTGSNGKTTVNQMLASILRAGHGAGALATAGNLNNHIGVPLTLLRLRQDDEVWHRVAALELGMNDAGEIALLARLVAPTVALVNNAQREHQEFLGSVQAVAEENGAVIRALGAGGTAVLPLDDAYFGLWSQLAGKRRVISFGSDSSADVFGGADWDHSAAAWRLRLHTPIGEVDTTMHQPGRHNLRNALAAGACALAAGESLAAIAQGLREFRPVSGRSQVLALHWQGQACTVVNDSYNANPDSVLAAIEVLAELPGPRWLVLGDMAEVGSEGPQFHAEVGARALASGIEHIWSVGPLCAHLGGGRHFDSVEALLRALPEAPSAAAMLVKGSRSMRMERVVQAIEQRAQPATAAGDQPGVGASARPGTASGGADAA